MFGEFFYNVRIFSRMEITKSETKNSKKQKLLLPNLQDNYLQ